MTKGKFKKWFGKLPKNRKAGFILSCVFAVVIIGMHTKKYIYGGNASFHAALKAYTFILLLGNNLCQGKFNRLFVNVPFVVRPVPYHFLFST